MGHDKIYKNESEYVFASIMDDVENIDAKKYLIEFHAKSIYPVIKELVNRNCSLDKINKDPQTIAIASWKFADFKTFRQMLLMQDDYYRKTLFIITMFYRKTHPISQSKIPSVNRFGTKIIKIRGNKTSPARR